MAASRDFVLFSFMNITHTYAMINTEGLHVFLPFHEEIRALSRNIFTSGCAHACSELTLLYNYYYYYCIIVLYNH